MPLIVHLFPCDFVIEHPPIVVKMIEQSNTGWLLSGKMFD